MLRILLLFAVCFPCFLHAEESLQGITPKYQVVGTSTLKYSFWKIYDATLYAPEGKWNKNKPFALQLIYYRNLKGTLIAERTIKEIRKLGFNNEPVLKDWYEKMQVIFPDVKKGSELTAVYTPNQPTQFYQGSNKIGQIDDVKFGECFFSIWLSEKTSEPKMRQQLLGLQ